jgi:phosphoglycolate phosphatase-like HAD superfamily hydrolase
VFVIGDTPRDVTAARRAGFQAVGVASGSISYQDLLSAEPDYMLRDMTEAFDLFAHIEAAPVRAIEP